MTPAARALGIIGLGISVVLATGGGALRADEPAFYQWDDTIPDQPGRLLRTEALPAELRIDGVGEQFRILYSSIDGITDEPIVVSGLFLLPEAPPPDEGWPLLAWAHGTTGISDACAPSRAGPGSAVRDYLRAWLDEGYAVVATDYQGLGTPGLHPYLVKRAEGRSVLDSIRAAYEVREDLAPDVVIAGQSQGGGAAFASAAIAPDYAPDVPLLGTIATGLPYLTADMPTASAVPPDQVDPGLAYMFYVAHVATALDPSLEVEELISRQALPVFQDAERLCIGELMGRVRDVGLTGADTLRPGAIARMIPTLLPHYVYPTLQLEQPILIATGTEDRDVDPRGQLMLVRDSCQAGSVVRARLFAGEDHSGAWLASLDEAIGFAAALRSGEPIEPDCAPEPVPR